MHASMNNHSLLKRKGSNKSKNIFMLLTVSSSNSGDTVLTITGVLEKFQNIYSVVYTCIYRQNQMACE